MNDSFFDEIGYQQAWLMGLLAADGNVRNQRHFSLSQSGDGGKLLLEVVKEMISFGGSIYTATTKCQDTHRINVTSQTMVERLGQYGIVPRKSLTLRFPEFLDSSLDRIFLRGYVDGDGSVGIYDSGSTKYLALSFVGTMEFVDGAIGKIPLPYSSLQIIKRARNLTEVRFNGRRAVEISEWLWQDSGLPVTPKHQPYIEFITHHFPKWMKSSRDRAQAELLFLQGCSVQDVVNSVGIVLGTAYRWKAELKLSQSHLETIRTKWR